MANLMGILGGVGQGISGGVQDLERMDEAKFRKEQQARERAKWAEEEAAAKELAGIRRENVNTSYEGVTGGIDTAEPKVTRTARPQHEVLSDMASVYAKRNTPESIAKAIQLKQAARTERESSAVDAINESFAPLEEAIRTNNLEGITKGLAAFNADQFGPTSTKGVTATPVAGPKGEMMYKVDRPGAGALMIPQDKLGDALQAMKMDALASAAPTVYGKLNIERKAGETDRTYKTGMLDVYGQRNALDAKELGLKANLWGAQAEEARDRLKGFQQILSQDEDGKIYGIKKNGEIGTMQGPMDSKGKPVPLFPKVTGTGGAGGRGKVDVKEDKENGGWVAFDPGGAPKYSILPGGLEVPLGTTNTQWQAMQKDAASAGVKAVAGHNTEGMPEILYQGKDSKYYRTIEAARKAK